MLRHKGCEEPHLGILGHKGEGGARRGGGEDLEGAGRTVRRRAWWATEGSNSAPIIIITLQGEPGARTRAPGDRRLKILAPPTVNSAQRGGVAQGTLVIYFEICDIEHWCL
ncbi:hypothetical protein JYU34_002176 [Plutella xylostella]|uniref:Uncharacterized protein n=1 Tax=Plutella xylostella TaxID=51655 RepID=A0ABQ7R1L5_PLUXY|nr:hypothetical protein JYU34_002176 [Plutella xylostella]